MRTIRSFLLIITIGLLIISKSSSDNFEVIIYYFTNSDAIIMEVSKYIMINLVANSPLLLTNIVLAIGVFLICYNTVGDSLFYALLALTYGWFGFFLMLLILIDHRAMQEGKHLNRIIGFLILGVFAEFGGPSLMILSTQLQDSAAYQNSSKLFQTINFPHVYTAYINYAFAIVVHLIITIFISLKFYRVIKKMNEKPALWIVLTMLSGVIPWIVFNLIHLLKQKRFFASTDRSLTA